MTWWMSVGTVIMITCLQTLATVGWAMRGDWRQTLFWAGLAICNGAYVLMVTK